MELHNKNNLYKKLFDGLQEGILVVEEQNITMMNELSNKVLSHVSGMKDFQSKTTIKGEMLKFNQLDFKLFNQYDINGGKS